MTKPDDKRKINSNSRYPLPPETIEQRRLFLEKFKENGCNMEQACKDVGIDDLKIATWKARFPEFYEAYEDIKFSLAQAEALARGSIVIYGGNRGRNITNVEEVKERFLEHMVMNGGFPLRAASNIHPGSRTHVNTFLITLYRWRKEDPVFFEKWKAAEEMGCDVLEEEMYRRGVEGWDEEVYQKGALVGTVRKYDRDLLIKLAAARKPDKFGMKLLESKHLHLHQSQVGAQAIAVMAEFLDQYSVNRTLPVTPDGMMHLIEQKKEDDRDETQD